MVLGLASSPCFDSSSAMTKGFGGGRPSKVRDEADAAREGVDRERACESAIFTVKHKTLEHVCSQTSKRVTLVMTYESGQVLTAHESCLV